jgi:hypothetical protein
MDEIGEDYIKENKSDIERQTLNDLTIFGI